MYSASRNGHLSLVQFLHENGAAQDVNEKSWNEETPLWRVCKNNSLDIVQWLILQGTPSKTTSWFNQLNYLHGRIDELHESIRQVGFFMHGGTTAQHKLKKALKRRNPTRLLPNVYEE